MWGFAFNKDKSSEAGQQQWPQCAVLPRGVTCSSSPGTARTRRREGGRRLAVEGGGRGKGDEHDDETGVLSRTVLISRPIRPRTGKEDRRGAHLVHLLRSIWIPKRVGHSIRFRIRFRIWLLGQWDRCGTDPTSYQKVLTTGTGEGAGWREGRGCDDPMKQTTERCKQFD